MHRKVPIALNTWCCLVTQAILRKHG